MSPDAIIDQGVAHLYGVATLPDGARVACGCVSIRLDPDDDLSDGPLGTDVLDFYVPLGSLSRVWPQVGAFPFDAGDEAKSWQEPLEEWLGGIGARIFESVRFRVGFTSHEQAGQPADWREWKATGVPPERGCGVLWPEGDAVHWYPATIWGGVLLDDAEMRWGDGSVFEFSRDALSPRERDVFEKLVEGASTEEISKALGLSRKQVRKAIDGITNKGRPRST